MIDDIEELYDYDVVRSLDVATLLVVRPSAPVVVLGSRQSPDIFRDSLPFPLRRRRGGGGAVLLQPDDVWLDWWLPAHDPRWNADVQGSSVHIGSWWREALSASGVEAELYDGPLSGDVAQRVICFAGRGAGEIFVSDRKLVGLTQWRVREGSFISTVLPAHDSDSLVTHLLDQPPGIYDAIDHHTLETLGLDGDQLVTRLRMLSAPVTVRQLYLVV